MWKILKLYFKDNTFYNKKDIGDICKVFEGIVASDFMPFISNKYYVPKPAMITEGLLDLNIKDFKYHRVMKYIEISDLPDLFYGRYDFEKKSSLCFGQYTYNAGTGKFVFADNAGIYAVTLSEEPVEKIKSKIRLLENDYEINHIEIDQIDEFAGKGTREVYFMLLNSLYTKNLSHQQLSKLLQGAFYQVGHKKNQDGLFILPGACFKTKYDWLTKQNVLLELDL